MLFLFVYSMKWNEEIQLEIYPIFFVFSFPLYDRFKLFLCLKIHLFNVCIEILK